MVGSNFNFQKFVEMACSWMFKQTVIVKNLISLQNRYIDISSLLFKSLSQSMALHQMKPELVQMIKKIVNQFNLSSETYYHAVFLFNMIQLKNDSEPQPEYHLIPLRKINMCWESQSDSDCHSDSIHKPVIQYQKIHHTQMPNKDKIQLAVCLFLIHKLHEPYPLCLSYLLRQLEIDERFEEYVISLEMEFLVRLAYKIQNLLPSNQAIFACYLWDKFAQNISSTCIDVRFGIKQIFQSTQKKIRLSHLTNHDKIMPEFKDVQTKQTFQSLSNNIQILVHNKALYRLYIKKSLNQNPLEIPQMKKIGLAIAYVTIVKQTNNLFSNKYNFNQNLNPSNSAQKTDYLDFVFNDFLGENFGISLKNLDEEISVTRWVLEDYKLPNHVNSVSRKTKICTAKKIEQSQAESFVKFLLRAKEKPALHEYHHIYHKKCKKSMSISSTKTDKQTGSMHRSRFESKCQSIMEKNSFIEKKNLLSTVHNSNIGEKVQSVIGSIGSNKSDTSKSKNSSKSKKNQIKSSQFFESMDLKILKPHKINIDFDKKALSSFSLMNQYHLDQIKLGNIKVSQFKLYDV